MTTVTSVTHFTLSRNDSYQDNYNTGGGNYAHRKEENYHNSSSNMNGNPQSASLVCTYRPPLLNEGGLEKFGFIPLEPQMKDLGGLDFTGNLKNQGGGDDFLFKFLNT